MIEELLAHEPVVALAVLGLEAKVLVEIERDHILEGEPFLLMEVDQFAIERDGRGSSGQAQYRVLAARLTLSNE